MKMSSLPINPPHQIVELFILYGCNARQHGVHHAAHKRGGPSHRQAVGIRSSIYVQILHADAILKSRGHSQQHAAGMGGLGEKAVDMISVNRLQAVGNAARRTADAAWNIDKQRMRCVHGNLLRLQLRAKAFPPPRCNP